MRKAVFLDRDGVVDRADVRDGKPFPPAGVEELEILPGVPEALAKLRVAGYLLLVVTNQPDVARGTTTREKVEAIHSRLLGSLPLDRIYTCWHDEKDDCPCRKPKPGLLLEGAREFEVDMNGSFMVGDRWKDIEAGKAAGCGTIFIDKGYNEKRPVAYDHRAGSLPEALDFILKGNET